MKTLTVTLKQHTPLIHFQHTQYGATLRASEVKPKLDRFLLSKLENEKKDNWLLKNSGVSQALDYKIKIQPCEKACEYLVASYLKKDYIEYLKRERVPFIATSPYFAQEKQNEKIIKEHQSLDNIVCTGMMFNNKENTSSQNHDFRRCNNVIVTITSFNNDLIDKIAEQIQTFFLIENFGSRQNKGFGCFEVKLIELKGSDKKYIKLKSCEEILISNFKFCYKKVILKSRLQTVFKTIVNDYKLLKSGMRCQNYDGEPIYKRSKLMLYGTTKKMRWEKKYLKEQINKKYWKDENSYYELESHHEEEEYTPINDEESYVYLRALLGVANQYEFLLKNPPMPNKKMVVSIKSVDGVERFKSPIIFKVIDENIYIMGNDVPEDILDKKFYFEVTVQEDDRYKNIKIDEPLSTPKSFNLISFMDKYATKLGYEKIK